MNKVQQQNRELQQEVERLKDERIRQPVQSPMFNRQVFESGETLRVNKKNDQGVTCSILSLMDWQGMEQQV